MRLIKLHITKRALDDNCRWTDDTVTFSVFVNPINISVIKEPGDPTAFPKAKAKVCMMTEDHTMFVDESPEDIAQMFWRDS